MRDHPFVKAVAWAVNPIYPSGAYVVIHEGRVIWSSERMITNNSAAQQAKEDSQAIRDAHPGSHLFVRVIGT